MEAAELEAHAQSKEMSGQQSHATALIYWVRKLVAGHGACCHYKTLHLMLLGIGETYILLYCSCSGARDTK